MNNIGSRAKIPRLDCLLSFVLIVDFTTAGSVPCANSEQIPCRCEKIKNYIGYFEDHVNCSRENLSEVPATLPEFLTVLDFSHNQLLPEKLHTLCKYINVAQVSLAYNHLTDLPDGQLKDCYISQSLNVAGNIFSFIDSNSLLGLEDVKTISGLEAQRFHQDAFTNFRELKRLSIKTHQQTIPVELFDSMELNHLSITVSGALQIPNKLLHFGTTSLQELFLESISLQRVPDDLLKHLQNTEKITLRMNDIHGLPAGFFQYDGESHLHTLHIAGVNSLSGGIFNGLNHLSRLEIHGIEDFPSNLFKGLIELVHLDLTNCYFSHNGIPRDMFAGLQNLKSLNLSRCSISSLDENNFVGLQSLEILNASFNSIRYLSGMPFQHIKSNVKEIILRASGISEIEATVFNELTQLKTLDLSDNNIYFLDENSFEDLIELEHLMLYRNKLTHLPPGLFRTLRALKSLNLAYNVLDEEPGNLLSGARNLSVLNLSDNRIMKLSPSLVKNLVGLTYLNLDYNPLKCDCETLQVRDILLSRNVHLIARCAYPNQRSLEKVPLLDCPKNSVKSNQSVPLNPTISGYTTHFGMGVSSRSASVSDSSPLGSIDAHDQLSSQMVSVSATQVNSTLATPGPSTVKIKAHDEYINVEDNLSMQTKHYISVAAISFISFMCVVILVCLACKGRRSQTYELPERCPRDIELDKFIDSPVTSDSPRSISEIHAALKETPSVQIDTVDDDGNVSTVTYSATEVPIMGDY